MKRMTKKNAMCCAVHKAVLNAMHDRMILSGACSKEQALSDSGFDFCEDYIRWDYIREFVQEKLDEEVIPVAARYWKMTPEKRAQFPERALALGYGKKTAGLALISWSPEMTQRYRQQKLDVLEGVAGGVVTTSEGMKKHGILPATPSVPALPKAEEG